MSARPSAAAVLLFSTVLAGACAVSNVPPPPDPSVHEAGHLKVFTVDDNPIDDPGSPGERRAIEYVKNYFESLGLTSSIQSVPLVQMVPTASMVQVHGPDGGVLTADSTGANFVVWAGQQQERVSLDSGIVFAGYGIVSPEYNRNDFKDVDVTGKIVLVLEGSPLTGLRHDLGTLGETYYGTRYYKFAEGARHGAAAVFIIHVDLATPWSDIQLESTGSQIDIDAGTQTGVSEPKALAEGWLSQPAARKLFSLAGLDYDTLATQAHELAFRPMEIPGVRVTIDMTSRIARFTSQDAFAVLPGQTSEYVMLASRWNRLDPAAWSHTFAAAQPPAGTAPGTAAAPPPAPDDDGSGAAVVMEAARRLAGQPTRPLRSIVFMVATALKPGIIGLKYYLDHPLPTMPLDKLTALIFMDRAHLEGTSRRVGKIGTSSDGALAQITREAAIEQGRLVELDQSLEKRFYYKFSQTALARDGVRLIYLTTRPTVNEVDRVARVARIDEVVGTSLPVAIRAPDPTLDEALVANITIRAANATNWPPRTAPAAESP